MSAIITRIFLQRGNLFRPKTCGKPPDIACVYTAGAHLTPASQNIIRPRQFHNAAFAAASLLLPLRQSTHVLKRRGKKLEVAPRREVRVFLRLNLRFQEGECTRES